ncbi:MAG: amidohydrolase [Actinomycetota bacterium]|nr:amidohydrolase [Actinomycetota bacterium]
MGTVLFTGGPIITFGGESVTALAVHDDRIVAIGDEAATWATTFDQVVQLAGRPLLPAFRDGHAHPLHGGVNLNGLDLTDEHTLDGVLQRVRDWAREHPDDPWIIGHCYHPPLLPGGMGSSALLDTACADRPVVLYPTDYHAAWCNTAAFVVAGIDAATPDPALGTIVRHGDGTPVGMLLEYGAMELLDRHIPTLARATHDRGLTTAQHSLSSEGIVWAQEAAMTLDELEVYADGARRGALTCRINAALWADPIRWPRQLPRFVEARDALRRDQAAHAWLDARTVKFFADGVIEAGTGFLLEPYDDDHHTCGLPNWSPEGLAEAARAFDADGFQIHIHAIGDGGVRMALDAIEFAARMNGQRDRRPVIAHTQLVHPADYGRFAALGVVANFEPLWACLDESQLDLTFPRLGPTRSALQYPIASLARSGARVSFGSDWPVSSHRPLDGLAVAVTRRNQHGEPVDGWLPDERLPILQAIHAYTAGTAYQAFDDDAAELRVGARADLVVLDRDITAIAGDEVPGAMVDQTWVGGTQVYQR